MVTELTALPPGSEYTSTLQWPVTHDIEVEATVHYADVGGYSIRRAVVLAYGMCSECCYLCAVKNAVFLFAVVYKFLNNFKS